MNKIKIKSSDFMCRCSKKEKRRCNTALKLAREKCQWKGDPITDIEFVDCLLYRLTRDGKISIISDQWAAVSFTIQKWNSQEKKLEDRDHCYIQCDSIVDGLAAAYLWYEQVRSNDPDYVAP